MRLKYLLSILLILVFVYGCRKFGDVDESTIDKRYSGGANTVFDESGGAFAHEFPTLTANDLEAHEVGDGNFELSFVTAPSAVRPGLGPVYNNVSCSSCHHAHQYPEYSHEIA